MPQHLIKQIHAPGHSGLGARGVGARHQHQLQTRVQQGALMQPLRQGRTQVVSSPGPLQTKTMVRFGSDADGET